MACTHRLCALIYLNRNQTCIESEALLSKG